MAGINIPTLAAAKSYTNKTATGVKSTSYDYDTSTLTCTTTDGNQFQIGISNGMNSGYKTTLDNAKYDKNEGVLKVDGKAVMTEDEKETENINMDNWF